MVSSMSGVGNCYDHPVVESFFGLWKQERVHRLRYRTRAKARMDTFNYIERCYNRQRRHSPIYKGCRLESMLQQESLTLNSPVHKQWGKTKLRELRSKGVECLPKSLANNRGQVHIVRNKQARWIDFRGGLPYDPNRQLCAEKCGKDNRWGL